MGRSTAIRPRPLFRRGRVHVRAPATSANLGPGFDTLGLALTLYDDVVASVRAAGLVVEVAGEGAHQVPHDETHLVVRSMRAAFDRLGGQPGGIELAAANRIPHGRGLGSSAAAIVAGILLARALVPDGEAALPGPAVLGLAAELEGHPDNVAACLLGGLTVAWIDAGRASAVRVTCDPAIRPVLLIPPSTASTDAARARLPAEVSHTDATFNASRAALLVTALTGKLHALPAATEDRLHQPYRAPAMPQTAGLMARLRAAELAAVVSGAGPAVLVLARTASEAHRAGRLVPEGWRTIEAAIDLAGAHVAGSAS
jgi:homoserine kinase